MEISSRTLIPLCYARISPQWLSEHVKDAFNRGLLFSRDQLPLARSFFVIETDFTNHNMTLLIERPG